MIKKKATAFEGASKFNFKPVIGQMFLLFDDYKLALVA